MTCTGATSVYAWRHKVNKCEGTYHPMLQCGSLVFCNSDPNQALVTSINKDTFNRVCVFLMWHRINKWCCLSHPLRTCNTASPVFLLQLLVGLLLKLGQKLLQQFLGSVSVFERAALVGKVECGALAGVEDQLKLNFGFTIWADLLACAKKQQRAAQQHSHQHTFTWALHVIGWSRIAHSEYLHRGGWLWSGLCPLDPRQYAQPSGTGCHPASSGELSSPPAVPPLITMPWLQRENWEST